MQQEHIDDLIAPYVLGALEPDELEVVEVHLQTCQRCQALVDEEHQVVALLPYLPLPVDVPKRTRRALMARVEEPERELEPVPARGSRVPATMLRVSWLAASVAAVMALVFFWHSNQMQQQVTKKDTQLVALEGQQDTVMSFVTTHGGFTTKLQGSGGAAGATGAVIVDPTDNAVLMMVDGLPAPRPGHAYVVWAVRGDEHIKAGFLPVDHQGHAVLRMVLPEAVFSFDSLIITDETGPAVAFPSGTRLMSAHVSH
jgi:hypothetical protein